MNERNPDAPARAVTAMPFDPWLGWQVAAEVAMATGASPQRLDALRTRRLAALLKAAEASPHYRRVLAGRDPERVRLAELPVARKADLMRHFADWVSDPDIRLADLRRFVADPGRMADAYLGRYTVWESSGSTAEPAIFLQDAHAMAVYDALEALRRPPLRPLHRWLDPWCLTERMAFVGATGGHFASTVSVERLRRGQPGLARRLRSFSILQPLPAVAADLQAFAPTVLATYPSAAVVLAHEQRAGRLRLALQEVWTGGEVLSDSERGFVQESFDCLVSNSYGASEFLALAFECHRGSLHLNSDWAIVETVDASGRPACGGGPGTTTLLTNLANHVQPLIRYDLGDRITWRASPCACGSSLPALTVEGRDDDTLIFAGHAGSPDVRVVPLALSTVLEDAGLFDFQLVQTGPKDLLLTTGGTDAVARRRLRAGRQRLSAFLHAIGAPGVCIQGRSGQRARPGRTGKTRRVVAAAG